MNAVANNTSQPALLTQDEAVRFLRLDTLGLKRPDLSLRRYRSRRGGYLL